MKFFHFVTCVIVLLISNPLSANYRFKHLESRDNLSNNRVIDVIKDNDGFVWIATSSGLNRYDGYEIKVYRHIADDSTSLRYNYVSNLILDTDCRLWMMVGGSFAIYDPVHDNFINNVLPIAQQMGLNAVPDMIATGDRITWIYIKNDGLYRYENSNATKIKDAKELSDNVSWMNPINGHKSVALLDRNNCITVINYEGKTIAKNSFVPAQHSGGIWMAADNDGLLWVFGDTDVHILDTYTGNWLPNPQSQHLNGRNVRDMAQDSRGHIWFALDNDGILIYDKTGNYELVQNDPLDYYSLANNSVSTIYIDGHGTVWVGTQKKGVSIYNESEFKIGLKPLSDINCMAAAIKDNCYWLATDKEGLIYWDKASNKYTIYRDTYEGPTNAAITCLAPTDDGSVWFGTFNHGLKLFKNGKISRYGKPTDEISDNIWAILPNPDGTLWLGTLDRGIQLLNPANGKIVTLNQNNSGLKTNCINSLVRGSDGKIYAATAYGLSIINPITMQVETRFADASNDSFPFSNLFISHAIFDSRGLLWMGTLDGLLIYNTKTNKIYPVSLPADLDHQFVLGIIEDTQHYMWVSINDNLVNIKLDYNMRTSEPQFTFRTYNSKDGTQNCAFNQRSLLRLSNGDIAAGGLYGLSIVSPSSICYNLVPPKVMLTRLMLGDNMVDVGKNYDGQVILPESLNHLEKLVLNHNQNSFTIFFSSDNYVLPNYTTYMYSLDGFNDEWLTCEQGIHHATYTNLAPGKYTLQVKAINNDGIESSSEASLIIEIKPPVWETIWAKIIYAILAVTAALLILRSVKNSERRRYNLRQQAENAQRQEELNQMKFRFYTNVSHELRTPLTLILSPVESMIKENTDEHNAKRLNIIQANAKRLLYLVNQLLDFRKAEVAALTFNGSSGNIVEFIGTIVAQFSDLAETKGIQLEYLPQADSIETIFDADKISKVIANLLSNALKFTPSGGKISVNLYLIGKMIRIKVIDTGSGVSDNDKIHIFERFYQSPDNKSPEGGSGIGLSLVKEYLKLHKGDVWVKDTPGGGATFTVELPIRDSQTEKSEVANTENTDKESTTSGEKTNGKSTVLIVDDNHDLVDFLAEELNDEFNVLTAYDGLEAIDLLRAKDVDVIVSDLMMPQMDGIELCRRVKNNKNTATIPVIILTAKQDVGSKVEGLSIGADDYMTKPFNNDVLRLKLRRLAGLKRNGSVKRNFIIPEPEPIKITSLDKQFIERATKYVDENISRSDLSVEELSRELGMSRVNFYKRILQLTGKTPSEFIRVIRIKRAAQYLRESQLNVSEIAYKVGINNHKYFSKYFQDEYGMVPSEYQKKKGV